MDRLPTSKLSTRTNVKKTHTVLYADDDIDDQVWVEEACKAIDCSLEFQFVGNGKEVLNYLSRSGKEWPALIVLDLNMPEMDGRQTLQKIKSDTEYKEIPVVIVTTSSNKVDKEICSRLGANLYLTKPDSHKEWQSIIRRLQPFIND